MADGVGPGRQVFDDIFAGILVGGQGRRLGGVDKARLPTAGGQTFVQAMCARVSPWVHSIVLAGRPEQAVAYPHVPYVADAHANAGPLAGLQSLLQTAPSPWCWLIAVDMPAVSGQLLASLAAARTDNVAVVVPYSPQGMEPCAALYHRRLLAPIQRNLACGTYALRALIVQQPHICVPIAARHVQNINHWRDFAALKPA